MFTAEQICFSHPSGPLLSNVSFILQPGQFLKITGNNGHGKTTLLKILALLLPQDSGALRWNQQPIHHDPDEYREETLYIGHRNGLADDLTPLENLHAAAGLRRRQPRQPLAAALDSAGLAQTHDRLCRQLSAGQKRRAALARLQAFAATLWLLDEPLAALDADGKTMLTGWLQDHLNSGGMAISTLHQPDDWPLSAATVIHCTRS